MRKYKKKRILFLIILLGLIVIIKPDGIGQSKDVIKTVKESDLSELWGKNGQAEEIEGINIRVLIMGNGYKEEVHPKVRLVSEGEMCILSGDKEEKINAMDELILEPDDERFADGRVSISSDKKIRLAHLERGCGIPAYEGKIELRTTAEGIVIINEIPVEKYLKAVVPSEMPASYELEALKAQAVCARSYAYRQMENFAYPEYEAHVNDSTDYQVYGNSETHKETNLAIKETEGEAVYYNGEIASTYYYSTSCGKTTDVSAWGTKKGESNAYLESVNVRGDNGDYEENLPWYRWSACISSENISNMISLYTGKDIGKIRKIEVTERGGGDVAVELTATGEKGMAVVETENKIRSALGGTGYQIKLNDGSITESRQLLPSAFFTIEKSGNDFIIEGGGLGHGIGMSQNGANEMAKQGKDYKEILEMFYQDIEIR